MATGAGKQPKRVDAYSSSLRWAIHQVTERMKGILLSIIGFTIVAGTASDIFEPPAHPTPLDHLANAALGAGAGFVAIAALAFLISLALAPYQQRKRLRDDLTASEAKIYRSQGRLSQSHLDRRSRRAVACECASPIMVH